MSTEFGKIAALSVEVRRPPTPLEREVTRTVRILTVVAVVLEVFGVFRPLLKGANSEYSRAKSVFKNTVPLDDVQLFIGSYVSWAAANNTGGATGVTTGRIIHFPDSYDPNAVDQQDWLIHELMHVWQETQTGPAYMAHALIGQATGGVGHHELDGLAGVVGLRLRAARGQRGERDAGEQAATGEMGHGNSSGMIVVWRRLARCRAPTRSLA